MVHTVIFDVGGTLVDAPDIFDIISNGDQNIKNEIVKQFQTIYSSENFYPVKEILRKITLNLNIDVQADKLYADIFINKSQLFNETIYVLESIKQKAELIIASDADADVLLPELKNLKIDKYFNKILISSDFKAYKPSDKFVKKMFNFIKKPYNEILFVGDSSVDIETAKKIGAQSVYIKRTEKKLNSNYEIYDLKELLKLI